MEEGDEDPKSRPGLVQRADPRDKIADESAMVVTADLEARSRALVCGLMVYPIDSRKGNGGPPQMKIADLNGLSLAGGLVASWWLVRYCSWRRIMLAASAHPCENARTISYGPRSAIMDTSHVCVFSREVSVVGFDTDSRVDSS